MANITGKPEVTTPASNDKMYIVDVSDTTDSENGSDGHVLPSNLITKAHGLSDGIVKVASGTMTPATAGTDYSTPSATETLTNKTIDANGTGNSISNIEVADMASSAIVTEAEGISANDNDTTIPTSAATKDYVDTAVAGAGGGTIGGSTGSTDNALIRADGAGGATIQSTGVTIDDNDDMDISGDLRVNGFHSVYSTYYRPGAGALGLQVEAGDSVSGTAGNLMLDAGDTSTGTGGNVIIKPGAGGSGTAGKLQFKHTTGLRALTVDYSAISTDRTLTIPDADINLGTIQTKLDTIETNADVTDATNVDAAGAVMNTDTSTASMSFVIDEDDMASDSATKVPTQQSVKAYVDANAGGGGGGGNPLGATYVIGSGGDYSNLGAYVTAGATAGDILYIDGTVTESADVTISTEVHIVGVKGSSQITHTGYTINFGGANTTISGVKFLNNANNADHVWVYGAYSKVVDCEFESAATTSLTYVLRMQSVEGVVRDCTFTKTGSSGSGDLLNVSNNNAKIINNHLSTASGLNTTSAYINNASSNAVISGNTITGTLSTNTGYGIENTGSYVQMIGNNITYTSEGIRTTGGFSNISGNSINNGSTSTYGIYASASVASITGNIIYASGTIIYLNSLGAVVNGNKIEGAGSGTGISIAAGRDDCVIVGNSIGSVSTGINVTASTIDNTTIVGNRIEATTKITDSGTATFKATATDGDNLNNEY